MASFITQLGYRHIDFQRISSKRRDNFEILHDELGATNLIPIGQTPAWPFVYPFYSGRKVDRNKLTDEGLFLPTFWEDSPSSLKRIFPHANFIHNFLPLPVDHRYGPGNMRKILEVIGRI